MERKSEVKNKIEPFFQDTGPNSGNIENGFENEILGSFQDFDYLSKLYPREHLNNNFEGKSNFLDMMAGFCSLLKVKKSLNEIHKCFNMHAHKIGYEYTAICISDEKNELLSVKTFIKENEVNSFNFPLSGDDNYLVQVYLDKSRKFANHIQLSEINCPANLKYLIIPLLYENESYGMIIVGSPKRNRQKDALINTFCNYLTLLISNYNLKEQINLYNDIDNLTGLYTHRRFQEIFAQRLQEAKKNNTKVSVLVLDVNNISGINRKHGHSVGDEVISCFANKIKNSIRKNDVAGRYGSDEIAVIMPETSNEKAKNLAKSVIANISQCRIDGVGKIKANVGIATYPTSAVDQEKLLILAEQSMLISKNNTNKNKSSVLSSKDIDFWNKTALDSLSTVINRRNFHDKYKFEEVLLHKLQDETNTQKISLEVVTSLAAAIDAKDTYTKGHSQSVSYYAESLAKALKLDKHTVEQIKLGAILHDVGKIGISESILRKAGPLTDHEWEVMKQHPVIGVKKILEPIKSLENLIPIVKHHHERIDGNGYPDRLKGEEIPYGARIVAIADAFHALISHRPYRKAASVEKALDILKSGAGQQWDKDLVEVFLSIAPDFSDS